MSKAETKKRQNKQNTEWAPLKAAVCCNVIHTAPAQRIPSVPSKNNKWLPSAHAYIRKKVKRDKERGRAPECERNSVRTAELHNGKKQHGSYQRGAPGLLQVAE